MAGAFIHEIRAYELLIEAGLGVAEWAVVRDAADIESLPFAAGTPVVLKGTALDVWHKSDLGLVAFEDFDIDTIAQHHERMKSVASAHGAYVGTLVARRVDFKRLAGQPTEALVALRKTPEAWWTIVLGIGGILTNAWGEEIRPLLWPVALTTPMEAFSDFRTHWLGKTWLGDLRQGKALTDEARLTAFFEGLWRLVSLLEREGAALLEMNPVVLDEEGRPIALDGVGTIEPQGEVAKTHAFDPVKVQEILLRPKTLALAGISNKPGNPGRIILDNMLLGGMERSGIIPIKPGATEIDGLPCLNGVEDLREKPVDILMISLPAPVAVETIEQLCSQGGGAEIVYLFSGGIGDGADKSGYGTRVQSFLAARRAANLWTPLIIGPNGLGFLTSDKKLNTLFIPDAKLPARLPGGPLALVSQSGAFLVSRLSALPYLPMRYACSIGNQMDLRLSGFLRALGSDPRIKVIATYVEGFAPGDLMNFAMTAKELTARGQRVVLYKGGRSQAGMAAASSHTGALAGDWELQRALLVRAGVIVCESLADFDAVMCWLASFPEGKPLKTAVITNAGFESVASADLVEGNLEAVRLTDDQTKEVTALIEKHGLAGLVSAHMPLDLTPMASEAPYLESVEIIARGEADSIVVGLVPLTQRLATQDAQKMDEFAKALLEIAQKTRTRIGVVVDAGSDYDACRISMMKAGLPLFNTVERALTGLKKI
ncbi:MAG: CoA-binding protein [Holophagales bacterium]|jgi:acyl-CoA synthetase (NDP forming)|nr:CoA-binding protein [Holophagales bacterium]